MFLNPFGGNVGIGTTTTNTTLDVAGTITATGLIVNGVCKIENDNAIEFGADNGDGRSVGKIGYHVVDESDGLDIVGAGSSIGNSQIHLWSDVYVHEKFWQKWQVEDDPNEAYWCWLEPNNGYVNNHSWNYATFTSTSDVRLKKNIKPIPSPLSSIRKLNGCLYDWNEDALTLFTKDIANTVSAGPNASERENQRVWNEARVMRARALEGSHVGVIAQDVEAVLPEAVITDADGYKSVRYQDLIPLLIEALKEQDRTITAQTQIVAQQQHELARLTAAHLAVQQQLADLAAMKAQVVPQGVA